MVTAFSAPKYVFRQRAEPLPGIAAMVSGDIYSWQFLRPCLNADKKAMSDTQHANEEERFGAYIAAGGGAMTAQRREVLRVIASMGPHFDAEELAKQLRRGRKPVSRATTYRTLAHLERSGIVRKVDFGEAHAHYESVSSRTQHEHLVCRACGQVLEATDTALEKRIEAIAEQNGFLLEKHTVQLVGLCRRCQKHESGR
jgi:Fur family transcriptional regulator, ferric uptake regulator